MIKLFTFFENNIWINKNTRQKFYLLKKFDIAVQTNFVTKFDIIMFANLYGTCNDGGQ